MRIPDIPYVVSRWRREHPDQQMSDGLILTQPWRPGHASPSGEGEQRGQIDTTYPPVLQVDARLGQLGSRAGHAVRQ